VARRFVGGARCSVALRVDGKLCQRAQGDCDCWYVIASTNSCTGAARNGCATLLSIRAQRAGRARPLSEDEAVAAAAFIGGFSGCDCGA
jgi:hypothetical protein